ncbi:MAG: aspartyl/asparaginyl beta-hydroxylase domain-containing protein [Rhodocyclaceae bacterium]|nr:aspartyl/asparaginyl beta-hydroxylase domain-containing protein [Rhodocyclaceae bacterium]
MSNDIASLEMQAEKAAAAGQREAAFKAWERILDLDPGHIPTLTNLGRFSLRSGDLVYAKRAFQRVIDLDGRDSQQWVNLALACKGLKDEAGEEAAIKGALTVDPMDLLALLMRGTLLEQQGKKQKAAAAFGAAVAVSPPADRLHPDLLPAVQYAFQFKREYDAEFGKFLDGYLAPHLDTHQGENLKRFRDSVDMMVGRKRRFDSQSMMHHYPGLAPIEFFERSDFPWLDAFEASTDAIRDEFLGVLADEKGFVPYITYPNDVPLNQWAQLNNSPDWSAYHLIKQGTRIDAHAQKCPATMTLLEAAPQPNQPGRTPAAMFSLLKPKTSIPPHTGVSNVRLVTHLPLIVPPGCGFRVGNETREWVPGKAWVFDDTIEHEAWNRSDQLRVVLIFDIWHPQLSQAERNMITALAGAVTAFTGEVGGYDA